MLLPFGADFARHFLIILGIGLILILLTLVRLGVILLRRVLSHGQDLPREGESCNAEHQARGGGQGSPGVAGRPRSGRYGDILEI